MEVQSDHKPLEMITRKPLHNASSSTDAAPTAAVQTVYSICTRV